MLNYKYFTHISALSHVFCKTTYSSASVMDRQTDGWIAWYRRRPTTAMNAARSGPQIDSSKNIGGRVLFLYTI